MLGLKHFPCGGWGCECTMTQGSQLLPMHMLSVHTCCRCVHSTAVAPIQEELMSGQISVHALTYCALYPAHFCTLRPLPQAHMARTKAAARQAAMKATRSPGYPAVLGALHVGAAAAGGRSWGLNRGSGLRQDGQAGPLRATESPAAHLLPALSMSSFHIVHCRGARCMRPTWCLTTRATPLSWPCLASR